MELKLLPDELPLPTWTRTLNLEDAMELLDAASPGLPVEEWRELGHAILPQASRARRQELVRIVERDLLDHEEGVVRDTVYLNLFQAGSPHERRTLLLGRLLQHRPLVPPALENLIHPALARMDEPLAPYDAALLPEEAWDALLRAVLPEGTRSEAFKKTRQTLQRFLAEAGVLLIEGNSTRTIRVQRARPASVPFGWLLAQELRQTSRTEASMPWALQQSFAARLFAPEVHYARSCVDNAVSAGVLERGYLMGEARLHPGPEVR